MKTLQNTIHNFTRDFSARKITLILIGAAISSFGIYNIHQQTNITEGGVLGMMLLASHWLDISSAIITPFLDIACYILAFRYLGGGFIKISVISTLSVSCFFKLWELAPPVLPDLSPYPLFAAVCGGVFVGLGVGLVVRQGGSSGGDDALALSISRVTKWRISRAYLLTDITVLIMSLSYISAGRIIFSLVTVTVSSFLIDFVNNLRPRPAA